MESSNFLENTHEYSLSQIFSTPNRKIIIPDFQRDYCWGDKSHGENRDKEVVTDFIQTLIAEHKEGETFLGKIDVYQNPKDHIYLTDGQQRLTTLYLLIGMLYRITKQENLKHCLISVEEESLDDKEPYLQYAIRESSLFFMRDLVNEFFIHNHDIKVDDIIKQPWYFSDYNLDPTIASMVNALLIIERQLVSSLDLLVFSDYVINKIKLQYYDVLDRKHGEERFVIINTTGKGLSQSENVKPILLGKVEDAIYSQQWEERENYFWLKKANGELIADDGVNDFLKWCFQIIDRQESFDLIKKSKRLFKDGPISISARLKKIHSIFTALKDLEVLLEDPFIQKQLIFANGGNAVRTISDLRNLKEKQQNIILPLLSFMEKISADRNDIYQFLRRLRKNHFDKDWKERNNNYVDWRYILQIIEKSDSLDKILKYDISNLKEIKNVPVNRWYNAEERIKEDLKQHKDEIEQWEDHKYFMGDLSFLFKTSLLSENDLTIPEMSVSTIIDFDIVSNVYRNYNNTIGLITSQEKAATAINLANLFRLFRIFIGCNKVEHIYKASWDFEGVLFSKLNRSHIQKLDYMKLLRSNDLENYCSDFILSRIDAEHLFELNNFTVEKFIKYWLVLKVFHANSSNVLLSFHDGNETGVAAYLGQDDNKISSELPFSIENSISGYGVRSGFGSGNKVRYAGNREHWLDPSIIDTPFGGINFDNFHSKKVTTEEIEENNKIISQIHEMISARKLQEIGA